MEKVSARLSAISKYIPSEFQKTTRDLDDTSKYTAKGFRLILLYVDPFAFKDVLEENEYKHFLLLHGAARILCSRELYKTFGPHAKLYLQSLLHVVEDTVNMDCPVTDFDAFLSENQMGDVKKHVKSGFKPLAQLCTKVERDLEINHEKVRTPPELQLLKSKEIHGVIHVQKLVYKSHNLSPKASNNYIFMKDGSLIRIKDVICSSLNATPSKVIIIGVKRQLLGPGYDHPTNSSHLVIYQVDGDDGSETIQLSLSHVENKAVPSPIAEASSN
ncbi:hypothetical protein QAD02_018400 [Eretmocerus hayati]|uniref:Uncharacterized protein n=1 Tax=Eretmocerus hayati TaxID=131215 RepID=A0ACC2PHQ8_9HYME|nr:hypothetical protein QAD02_018400 [Eretmocerus hayati]